jgi:hypothetical protein
MIMAASMALGLASFAAAAPASADNVLSQTVNKNSTFSLIRGGFGGHMGGFHGGFHHFGGPHFAGHFHGRPFFHHHRFHRRFVFVAPFFYGDYYGGSCYWNCRQYHGPHFCRLYAYDYCY